MNPTTVWLKINKTSNHVRMLAEPGTTMAAATEAFVEEKIQEAEGRWKAELAKIKEELTSSSINQSSSGSWKERSQIQKYKDKFALRKKEANHEKPTIKLNDDNVTEFKQQMTGWMKALHPVIKTVIDNLERLENRTLDEEDIKQRLIAEMRIQAEETYNIKIDDAIERQEHYVFEE